jgi:hypothetical protein
MANFEDGEVVGIDTDESLICWDAKSGTMYNCGEDLEIFGEDNLTDIERQRLNLSNTDKSAP